MQKHLLKNVKDNLKLIMFPNNHNKTTLTFETNTKELSVKIINPFFSRSLNVRQGDISLFKYL